jgi:hypothetical protein
METTYGELFVQWLIRDHVDAADEDEEEGGM